MCGGRDLARGEAVVAEIEGRSGRARFVPGDVADPANASALVAEARRSFGGVDAAVACSIRGDRGPASAAVERWTRRVFRLSSGGSAP